uniref:Uncharacterized protein n=1 Tax=Anser cygnoides TaxID=8845 RepID=A0A8B9IET2_ANSCY
LGGGGVDGKRSSVTPGISPPVQNGSVHQKDGLNDDDFEPYLSPQARPVRWVRNKGVSNISGCWDPLWLDSALFFF